MDEPRPWPGPDQLQPGALLVEWLARSSSAGALVAEPSARLRIGRARSCAVRLTTPQGASAFASRHHAEVAGEDGRVVVRDLKSTYGTTVNGSLLANPVTLRDGDVIEIVGHFFGARLLARAPAPSTAPVTIGDVLSGLSRTRTVLHATLAVRLGIEACRAWPRASSGLALVRDQLTFTATGALAALELASPPRGGAADDVGAVAALVQQLCDHTGIARHLDPRPTTLPELHEQLVAWLYGEVAAGTRRGNPPPWSVMDLMDELTCLDLGLPGLGVHPGTTPRAELAAGDAAKPAGALFSLDDLGDLDDVDLEDDLDDLLSPPTGVSGPPPAAPPPPPAAQPTLGPAYGNVHPHRVGPIASSFFAIHGAGGQEVFVKVLRPEHATDPDAVRRFHNEPQMARHLAERGVRVARLIDMAERDGQPFFAVERLHGRSLADAMRDQHSFTGRETFDVLRGCLQQAAAIHGAGVVHGDLSPENIFLRVPVATPFHHGIPRGAEPWLIDLECARTLDSIAEEPASAIVGKAGYLAPEVALDARLTVAADLYALGVVAYEMLAGRRPYPFTDLEQVRLAADTQMPPMPPLAMAPRLVEAFVAELIDPDPARRPASATEALARLDRLEDVHRWLVGPPPVPAAPGPLPDLSLPTGRAPGPPPTPLARPPGPPPPGPPPGPPPMPAPSPVPEDRFGQATAPGSTLAPGFSAPAPSPPSWMEEADDAPEGVYRREEVTTAAFRLPRIDSLDDDEPPETVQFSVFVPSVIQRANDFLLDFAIYPPDRRDEVLAARAGTSGTQGTPGLDDDAVVLDLELKLDGFEVESSMATVTFLGEPITHSLIVQAPADAPGGFPHVYPGQVQVLHKGLLIARLVFQVMVHGDDEAVVGPAEGFDALDMPTAEQMRVRSAFASYSSRDRDEVVRRVQGINATGVNVFLDVLDLRAGELWEAELDRRISQADMLYLFWSPNAARSDWVEKEWRCALAHHGISRIHPVPLVDPTKAPPPAELAALHFNDIYLRYVAPRDGGWLEKVLGKLKG